MNPLLRVLLASGTLIGALVLTPFGCTSDPSATNAASGEGSAPQTNAPLSTPTAQVAVSPIEPGASTPMQPPPPAIEQPAPTTAQPAPTAPATTAQPAPTAPTTTAQPAPTAPATTAQPAPTAPVVEQPADASTPSAMSGGKDAGASEAGMPPGEQPASGGVGAEALGKKPNILFIIVDDQSPLDLKVYNPTSELETPTLDRLASEGLVIDAAYHMGAMLGAVCTPSRHMVMSGRTVWHVAARPDDPGPELVPPDLVNNTLAPVFQRGGYATMRTCKNGNSYTAANNRFEVSHVKTNRQGNDEDGSAWHADRVLEYLDERYATQEQRPFMIYLGFSHPHDIRNGKPELLQKYGATNHTDMSAPPTPADHAPHLPENWLPSHPFPHGHNNLRDEVRVSGVWERRDPQTIRNEIGREYACSENIDIQIERVLSRLEQAGELENTYVVYTADHGMAIGRHGLQGKQNLYDHTWKVPFIVHGPGILPGRAPGNIYLTDVLSTLCDLAGIEAPTTSEGTSFLPVLDRRETSVRDVLYGVYAGGSKPGMRTVKQGDWKLIKYDVLGGSVRQTQLFNLKDNPNEYILEHHSPAVIAATGIRPTANQVNLAEDPQHAAKRAEMEALLKSEMARLDDPYTLWDQ